MAYQNAKDMSFHGDHKICTVDLVINVLFFVMETRI